MMCAPSTDKNFKMDTDSLFSIEALLKITVTKRSAQVRSSKNVDQCDHTQAPKVQLRCEDF